MEIFLANRFLPSSSSSKVALALQSLFSFLELLLRTADSLVFVLSTRAVNERLA